MFTGHFVFFRNVFGIYLFALVFLISLSLSPDAVLASARHNVMLVIDGSISMGGRIDQRSKISLVKKALAPALNLSRSRINLGVVSYGDRRRGDCGDVRQIIKPGKISLKRYMTIINGIESRGRTPITKAVNLAAKSLKTRSGQFNSIILITDGFDACDKKLATLGKDLKKKNPGLKVYVIGLRPRDAKMTSLRQLAKRTGGTYIAATTPGSIDRAVNRMFVLTSGGGIPVPRIGPSRLAQLAKIEKKQKKPVVKKPPPRAVTPEAKNTGVTTKSAKQKQENPAFGTGTLKVSSVASKGGPINQGATYIVFQTKDGGTRREISRSSKNRSSFTLPAGSYRLRVQNDLASIERAIKIEANKTKVLVLNLNAGYLKLFTRPAIGAEILKANVNYAIYQGSISLDGKRQKIAQLSQSTPAFWLAAGSYFITATYGLASASIGVKVSANKVTEKTIIVNAGALRLKSMVEGMPEKLKSRVLYVIYDAKADFEGNYREVFSTEQAEEIVRIPPGEYLIEGYWGNTNARVPMSAVVRAGKPTSATVVHRAGRARFTLKSVGGGTPTGKLFWIFYDSSGAEIGRNVKPIPERIFAAGRYIVVVRYQDQQYRAEFSIRSGDQKRIDIVATQ